MYYKTGRKKCIDGKIPKRKNKKEIEALIYNMDHALK